MKRAIELRQGDELADGRVVFSAIGYNRHSVCVSFYGEQGHHNWLDNQLVQLKETKP